MNKNFISKAWNKFNIFFFNEEKISSRRKTYNSLWAILFGIVISLIFISFLNVSPLAVLKEIYKTSIELFRARFIITIAVFIFSSIGVGIAFKAAMFNIGIPSQMMSSGIIGYFNQINNPQWYSLLLGFLLGIISSFLLGVLSGFLKAFLNVNEVVSTILVNWIVFWVISGVLNFTTLPFVSNSVTSTGIFSTEKLNFSQSFFGTEYFAYLILFVAILFALLMTFIFKKTTFGYKIKMIGLNKDAASYSGANNKLLIILALGFSGLFAGIAGFFWFIFAKFNLIIGTGPETIGFDAIAVSLLAYNSPIGSIFTSIFYSFLTTGSFSLQFVNPVLDSSIVQIATGLIIYFAAISVVFMRFKPIEKIMKLYYLIKSNYFFVDNKKLTNEILKIKYLELENLQKTKKINSYEWEIINKVIKEIECLNYRNKISIYKNVKNEFYGQLQANYKKFYNLEKITLSKETSFSYSYSKINKLINKNLKNNIKFLETQNLIYYRYIEIMKKLISWKIVPIFKAKNFLSCKLRKNYLTSKRILNLINEPNKIKWKKLKSELKNNFYAKASKNLNDEQKLELFREISDKRKDVNKQLLELGYEDQKILKEKYNVDKNEIKTLYLNAKLDIYKTLAKNNKFIDLGGE
ncbi:ABC transporter permease [[Mycoplasma] collis]|uniref:ABC transporter permease n=1 Tax=[Mycoplasma] collis TaxID=2127 RepID=UPI00055C5650|nr:ABC transporter permease [[Mycoplasma] collis]